MRRGKPAPDPATFGVAEESALLEPMRALRVKTRADLVPRKRRATPKGSIDDSHLHDAARLCRLPAPFLERGSTVGVVATLHRPLRDLREGAAEWTGAPALAPAPFGRAVLVIRYDDGERLRALVGACDAANTRAVGGRVLGSLRSHELSAEEAAAADAGELDVVCGFHLIDASCRTLVVEGRAATVEEVMRSVPRARENDGVTRVLSNRDARFAARLYTRFNVDLKKVRLRAPLGALVERPDVYDRALVDEHDFEGLHRLFRLRGAERLVELARDDLWPLPSHLLQLESKHGERRRAAAAAAHREDVRFVSSTVPRAPFSTST